jgi:uncharacterized protein
MRRPAASLIVMALVAASCGSGGTPPAQPGPRRTMLRSLANTVIVPTYQQFAAGASALADAAALLDASPDATSLAATQQAWRNARAFWKQSEAFAIGPAVTLSSPAKIDFAPAKPQRIESEIAGSAELTADYIEDLGANVKGFLGLEYLLFDPDGGDAAAVDAMATDPRRRRFVRAAAENLRDQAVLLRDAWDPAAGNFRAELGDAGQGSKTYPTVKSAIDALVNQLIVLSEQVADAQLLAALGTRAGGAPNPDALDAHRSDNGLADLLDDLTGIQNVYFNSYAGRSGASFSSVVRDLSPDVDGALSLAVERAMETATRIPQPLEQAITSDTALVERAQARAKELMQRLQIDLITVLGATLRFNPNDGD